MERDMHMVDGDLRQAIRSAQLTRRQFFRRAFAAGFSGGAIIVLAAACGTSAPATSAPVGSAPPTGSGSPATTKAATSAPADGTPSAGAAAPATTKATTSGSASQAQDAGPPQRGGAIIGAQQGDWKGYDPHRNNAAAQYSLIYDSFVNWAVQPDGSMKAEPALATEWQLTNDTATFKLRQGVKFHDGSDWNAEVAKFNIDRLLGPKSTATAYVSTIKSAEVVDPYTLKLNLKSASGALLSNLSQAADNQVFMISKALVDKVGDDNYGTAPEKTAGTGPMKVVEWVQGSYHVLQRTGNYWQQGTDGQPLPYFDSLKVRFIADDSVRMVELRSGNVQIIDSVQPKDIQAARQDTALELVENPYQVTAFQFTFSTKHGPFADNPKLRQAVAYALDREAVAKVLGAGIGIPMYYFLTPGYLGYDDTLPRYSFDAAKAKQLVVDAGYPNGLDVSLSIINRVLDTQQAQVLKQMLDGVGIRVTIDALERLAWLDKIKNLQYDMVTYQTGVRPDPDSILAGRFETGADKNYAALSDKMMDDLLGKGRASYDNSVRATAYHEVQKRIYDTAAYGTIWYKKYFDANRKEIKGRTHGQTGDWGLATAWVGK
jgi:peptide/nickel transport system substrate-binding protein